MKRQNFFLPDRQIRFLKIMAKKQELHIAEVLRRIIDDAIDKQEVKK